MLNFRKISFIFFLPTHSKMTQFVQSSTILADLRHHDVSRILEVFRNVLNYGVMSYNLLTLCNLLKWSRNSRWRWTSWVVRQMENVIFTYKPKKNRPFKKWVYGGRGDCWSSSDSLKKTVKWGTKKTCFWHCKTYFRISFCYHNIINKDGRKRKGRKG